MMFTIHRIYIIEFIKTPVDDYENENSPVSQVIV